MANIKIDNYQAASDEFILPNNPQIYDDDAQMSLDLKEFPLSKFNYITTGQGIMPKTIVMQGHFNEKTSVDKLADLNTLAKHIQEAKLKKVYFADDRFSIVMGKGIKHTFSGERRAFIDYTATWQTPISMLFSDTLQTSSYDGSWSNGSNSNDGAIETFIDEIEITFSGGGSPNETIEISDNSNNGIQVIMDNYVGGDTVTIRMIELEQIKGGYAFTKFSNTLKNNSIKLKTKRVSGKDQVYLRLQPGEQIDTFTIGGTANVDTVTFKFRSGYMA